MDVSNQQKQELLRTLLGIKNPPLLDAFLTDLLTPQEYSTIITRWQLVKQLYKGIPQRQIAKNLSISVAKITRGSRMLLNPKGGFRKVLGKRKNSFLCYESSFN